jgi:flagellar basal body-associated protein FliL
MSNFEELSTTQKMNGHVAPKAKKRIIKKIMIYLLVLLVVLGVVISLFINIHPAFGGNPSKEQKEVYNTLDNYDKGKFVYRASTKMNRSAANSPSTFKDSNSVGKETNPAGQIPVS